MVLICFSKHGADHSDIRYWPRIFLQANSNYWMCYGRSPHTNVHIRLLYDDPCHRVTPNSLATER